MRSGPSSPGDSAIGRDEVEARDRRPMISKVVDGFVRSMLKGLYYMSNLPRTYGSRASQIRKPCARRWIGSCWRYASASRASWWWRETTPDEVFGLGSVPGEDEITRFDRHVAGITAAKSHRVDGFTVVKLRVAPAAGCGVFRSISNHELNVCGIPRHE